MMIDACKKFYGGTYLSAILTAIYPIPYGYCHPETNQILPNASHHILRIVNNCKRNALTLLVAGGGGGGGLFSLTLGIFLNIS